MEKKTWKDRLIQRLLELNRKYTIKQKILASFLAVIIGMTALNLFVVYRLYSFNSRYDEIIHRTTNANRMVDLNNEIIFEAWPLSIGNLSLEESKMIIYFHEMETHLAQLEKNTEEEDSLESLTRAKRSEKILKTHGQNLITYVKTNGLSEQREKAVDAIRDVGELMKEYLNEYIFCELDHADVINKEISASVKRLILMNSVALILFGCLIMVAIFVVNNSISSPIKALVKTTKQVGSGDFNVRVNSHGKKDEIAILNDNFNTMVSRLQGLVDDVRISTENLKKVELQLLQEQINPHFLYNTLETIIWMAEKKDNEKVIKLVQDLSTFFHTTLSGGKAVITIKEELRHIESYLAIQQVRYEDIMGYHVDVAKEIQDFMIPKLTLQPIVENALYHGIKNKRGGGCIQIHGRLIDDQTIEIVIQDSGKGMDEETLAKLRENIQSASIINSENGKGFGLPNVQKRLQLYCGGSYGVTIDSMLNKGTTVTLHLGCDIHPKE